jgi:D-serine deaminase-like pyridoxal phosphate-dependent protein
VAKDPNKPEQETENPTQPAEGSPEAQAQQQQQQPQPQRIQVQIDDAKALASYANFCRVTGTPEELIIDFGLNPQPVGVPTQPIVITQRIITNFYTAKRMLHALQLTVQRHEATFGVLETDVQKRVRPGLMGGQQR